MRQREREREWKGGKVNLGWADGDEMRSGRGVAALCIATGSGSSEMVVAVAAFKRDSGQKRRLDVGGPNTFCNWPNHGTASSS